MASAGRKRTRFQAKVDEALDTAIGPKIIYTLSPTSASIDTDLEKALFFYKLQDSKSDWSSGTSTDTTAYGGGGHVVGEITSLIDRNFNTGPDIDQIARDTTASRVWLDYFELSGNFVGYPQTSIADDWSNLGVFDLVFEVWRMNNFDAVFHEDFTAANMEGGFAGMFADHFGFDSASTRTTVPPWMTFSNYKKGDINCDHFASCLATQTIQIRTFRENNVTAGSITNNTSATATVSLDSTNDLALSAGVVPCRPINMRFDIRRWCEWAPTPFGTTNSNNPAGFATHPIFVTVRSNSYGYLGKFDRLYVRVKYHEALNRAPI